MSGRFRRFLWPATMTAAMLIVLVGLGSWQVQRLFWKQAILARIDRAESEPPVPLTQEPAPFTKVSATGTFLSGQAALYGADVRDMREGPTMGARMIVPLRLTDGKTILVDRGWVPLSRPSPIDQPSGTVTVSGYVRSGDHAGWFSAADDPAGRRFFTLDPQAIGTAIGLKDVAPFVLVILASGPEPKIQVPIPARGLPRPPNSHLSYAITWYGLAIALLAIFAVWARKESRE